MGQVAETSTLKAVPIGKLGSRRNMATLIRPHVLKSEWVGIWGSVSRLSS